MVSIDITSTVNCLSEYSIELDRLKWVRSGILETFLLRQDSSLKIAEMKERFFK